MVVENQPPCATNGSGASSTSLTLISTMNTKVLAALSRTKKESATALQVPKQQHLCDNCSKLFLRPTIFADLATPRGVRHGLKPYDMVVNALAGCRICRELLCLAYKILRDRRTKDSDSSGIDEILRTWQENIEAANSTPTGWRRALPSKFLTSKRRVFDPDFRFSCNILQETDIKVACVGDKGRWSIAAANGKSNLKNIQWNELSYSSLHFRRPCCQVCVYEAHRSQCEIGEDV